MYADLVAIWREYGEICDFDVIRHTSTIRDDAFEWDDRKAKRNDRGHGVTFEIVRFVFDDPNAIDRLDLDEPCEDRELITGLVGDVCFVQRGHRKRIISAQKATYREQNDYNEANSPSQSDDR
jgi:uncharacterized DUF497 family protein